MEGCVAHYLLQWMKSSTSSLIVIKIMVTLIKIKRHFTKVSQDYDSFIEKQVTLFWVKLVIYAQQLIFNNTVFMYQISSTMTLISQLIRLLYHKRENSIGAPCNSKSQGISWLYWCLQQHLYPEIHLCNGWENVRWLLGDWRWEGKCGRGCQYCKDKILKAK